MANGYRARPGDLITTDAFNTMANQIDDLIERVTQLEGQAQPGPGPGPAPVGSMVITQVPTNPGPIQIGQTYDFPFILDSQTNIPALYTFTVLYSQVVGANANAWSLGTTIRNPLNQTVSNATIANGSPLTIHVRITIPAGAVSATMTIQVNAVHAPNDPLLNVSRLMPITIGQSPNVSDPRTTFEQLLVSPVENLVNDPLLGDVVETPVGSQSLVRVTANFTLNGTYAFSTNVVPPDPAWTAALHASVQTPTAQGPSNPKQIIVRLTANTADATPSRVLEIHAVHTGPGQQFDSWFPIAIRNA